MSKATLHLSIDTDLLELAKNMDLNLSAEFEDWIRIRTGNMDNNNEEKVDYDKEYARLQMELKRLESKKEMEARQEDLDKRKVAAIDRTIDQEMENTEASKIPANRSSGLIYIFKSAFNVNLTEKEAVELIENRMKERNLL